MEDLFEMIAFVRNNVRSKNEAKLLIALFKVLKQSCNLLNNNNMIKIITDTLMLIGNDDNNINHNDTIIYCLFECYSDIEGKIHFKLLHIFDTLDEAKNYSQLTKHASEFNPAHYTMTRDNNFTYIGNRNDCVQQKQYGMEHVGLGGYIIQEFHIN